MKKFRGILSMIIATLLWGVAFSAQSEGMKHIEPCIFTSLRSVIGVFALMAVIMVFDIFRFKKVTLWGDAENRESRRDLLYGGLWCGIVITFASICQQAGLKYTTAGKTGFLTALYIIIVPVLGIFFKRKVTKILWFAVAIAMLGAYFLCGGIGNIGKGELFVIVCAMIYSVHIMVIDRYAAKCDCVRLSCLQFVVASVLAAVISFVFREPWELSAICGALPFLLFCGIGSSAMAFTLQMVAQKYLHPVTATLLMSLESVFAVLGGWIFLHEVLTLKEGIGCIMIFAAVIISQLPQKKSTVEA